MSCCCTSPAQALSWAVGFNLLVFVPSAFYGLVQICFHYAEQEHQALSLVSTITCTGIVLVVVLSIIGRCAKNTTTLYAALSLSFVCTAFATGATLWGASVAATQADGLDLEGKILSAGTLLIVCIIFVLSPLVWLTYEIYAYRSQLRESNGAEDAQEGKSFMKSSDPNRSRISAAELRKPTGRTRRGLQSSKEYEEMSVSSQSSDEGTGRRSGIRPSLC